jgi:type VI secretion system protein ImpA
LSPSEIDLLQSPVEGPFPCGEDLEYDPDFMALQQATTGKREQQFGSTIIPAEPPDWARVERIAKQLCTRTRDLRVLVPLTLAWTENRGLPGYVDGLHLVDGVLQKFWTDVHPRVVVDGDFEDPLPRMNALAALAESEGLGRSVRDARLLDDGGSSMSLRQVEALLDSSKTDQIDYPGGIGRLREAAAARRTKMHRGGGPARRARGLLQRIRETSNARWARAGRRIFPARTLASHRGAVAARAGAARARRSRPGQRRSHPEGAVPICSCRPSPQAGPANGGAGLRAARIKDIEISSRDDVQVLLEKACEYLERTEPSHPAPMLIRRAQRLLLDLNFFQIIEELVPEGLQKIESLAGRPLNGAQPFGSSSRPRSAPHGPTGAGRAQGEGADPHAFQIQEEAYGRQPCQEQWSEVHRAQPRAARADRVRRRDLRQRTQDPAALRDGRHRRPRGQADGPDARPGRARVHGGGHRQLRRPHEVHQAARGLPGAQHAHGRRPDERRHHLRQHGRLLARAHRQARWTRCSSCSKRAPSCRTCCRTWTARTAPSN